MRRYYGKKVQPCPPIPWRRLASLLVTVAAFARDDAGFIGTVIATVIGTVIGTVMGKGTQIFEIRVKGRR
ncbi:MAG: hypothetical protein ACRDDA_09805 [Aeromonas sp.]